jgi:hypothetical protein
MLQSGWSVHKHLDVRQFSSSASLGAAVLGAIDYKRTFANVYESEDERLEAVSHCHTRSAKRVLRALLANGGMSFRPYSYIGLLDICISRRFYQNGSTYGFIVSIHNPSVTPSPHSKIETRVVLPKEWTRIMVRQQLKGSVCGVFGSD